MADDQLCEICGEPNAPFGYGPPASIAATARHYRSRAAIRPRVAVDRPAIP